MLVNDKKNSREIFIFFKKMFCVIEKDFARYRIACDITVLKSFYSLEEAIKFLVEHHITCNSRKSLMRHELFYGDKMTSLQELKQLNDFLVEEYQTLNDEITFHNNCEYTINTPLIEQLNNYEIPEGGGMSQLQILEIPNPEFVEV
jgi:hypothetical protein